MNEIKKLCHNLEIMPTKSKGQNFLLNDKILDKIVKAADLKPSDIILEIGPGLGILTEVLAKKVKKVIAVELDKKLASFLSKKFAQEKNIEIIQGDILSPEVSLCLRKKLVIRGGYKLVANIPYNITGAVLRKFLSQKPKPKTMVLMLQKEVGERIVEKNKKKSIISLITSFYGQSEIFGFVSKNNFWPRPKVDSVILKINLFSKNRLDINIKKEQNLIRVIKAGFSSPRKQIVNNLIKNWPKEKVLNSLLLAKINFKSRPEEINLEKWATIYRYLDDDQN